MEQLFETAVALAEQGRTMPGGVPKPLELALFTREFEQEVQAAFPPRRLQTLALAPLAWIARRRGRSLDHVRKARGCRKLSFPANQLIRRRRSGFWHSRGLGCGRLMR